MHAAKKIMKKKKKNFSPGLFQPGLKMSMFRIGHLGLQPGTKGVANWD